MHTQISKKHWCCFCERLLPEETGFVDNTLKKICMPCITQCNAAVSTGMRQISEAKIAELGGAA